MKLALECLRPFVRPRILVQHDGRGKFRAGKLSRLFRAFVRRHLLVGLGIVDEPDATISITVAAILLHFHHAVSTGALQVNLLYVSLLSALTTVRAGEKGRHLGRSDVIAQPMAGRWAAAWGGHDDDDEYSPRLLGMSSQASLYVKVLDMGHGAMERKMSGAGNFLQKWLGF